MFSLNVSSSFYWCLSRGHPQVGSEVNDVLAASGNGALSWSCRDALQPGQRMALSCNMVHLGRAAGGSRPRCAEGALRGSLS